MGSLGGHESGVPLAGPPSNTVRKAPLALFYRWANRGHRLPRWLRGKEPTCQCRRCRPDPRLAKTPGEGMAPHSSVLAWGNPMDRDAWQATVHGVARESDTT